MSKDYFDTSIQEIFARYDKIFEKQYEELKQSSENKNEVLVHLKS